jgi:hypothetical protein
MCAKNEVNSTEEIEVSGQLLAYVVGELLSFDTVHGTSIAEEVAARIIREVLLSSSPTS